MTQVAQCPECGKRYKVPHFDKAWQCKACQVPLEWSGLLESGSPALEDPATCPACGGEISGHASECGECGEALRGRNSDRASGQMSSRHESKARAELHRYFQRLLLVRTTVVVGFLFSLYTIVVTASKSIPGFDPFGGLSIIGGEILMLSFLLGAHWGLRFLSGAATRFSVLLGVLYGLTAWSKDSVAEAAVFWGVVAIYVHALFVLWKIRAIQEAHPEVLELLGGESKVMRKPKRPYMAEQKAWQHVLAYVLLLVAGGLLLFGDRAGTPDEKVLRNFFGAWNGNDKQAVATLSGDMSEEFYLEKLNEMDREEEWGGELPHMQSAKIYRSNDKLLAADLTGPQGGLMVRFYFRKERWLLVALEYVPAP